MIERAVNIYGQEQKINNLDKIVKIGDRYLQVRMIQTQKWKDRSQWHKPVQRAKFINPEEDERISYIVDREQVIKWKEKETNEPLFKARRSKW